MKIDREELLRYLGYHDQQLNAVIEEKLERAVGLCFELAEPRHVLRKFSLERDPLRLQGTDVALEGVSLSELLEDCDSVLLLAATVGLGVEREVSRLFYRDPTLAVMLDAAATCAIESVCDEVQAEAERKLGRALTMRFSCGYGDFPLRAQFDMVRLLQAEKIGITVNPDALLSPQKSVTALMGITSKEKGSVRRGCGHSCGSCGKTDCAYRK